jgi:hypothetical protein
MDSKMLKYQIDWISENSPYVRPLDIITVGADKRVYGLLHFMGGGRIRDQVYIRRSNMGSPLTLNVSDVVGINYSGYITVDEFVRIRDLFKSNVSLLGVSTYDSVSNVIHKMLVDKYENDVVLDGEDKLLFDTLYRGAKYFGELFIINKKPDWRGCEMCEMCGTVWNCVELNL